MPHVYFKGTYKGEGPCPSTWSRASHATLGARLTRAPLGYSAERAPLGGGGQIVPLSYF